MQRAAKDLQEVKEPWHKLSGAAVLWVFPKAWFGFEGGRLSGPCRHPLLLQVPATLPFLPPRRTAAGPRWSLFNSASHKFIMLIYHAAP